MSKQRAADLSQTNAKAGKASDAEKVCAAGIITLAIGVIVSSITISILGAALFIPSSLLVYFEAYQRENKARRP